MSAPVAAKESRANRKSSIENGRLVRVSVSQIKSFRDCDLKWWLDKRAKLPRKPPGKGQVLGDQCHKRIEHFLITGDDVRGPLERMGAEMLEPFVRFAPFNGGPLMVEAALESPTIFTPGGVEFVGYSDLILPPGYLHAGAVIIDHKFRKNLELYAETPEQLMLDDQAIVYAAFCFRRWPDMRTLLFAHHNHQTQGARFALPVQIELDRDFVLDRFVEICSLVDGAMQRAASKVTSDGVSFAKEGTCSKFGGCDFLTSCPNAPARRFAHSLIPGATRQAITAKEDPLGLVDAVRSQMKTAAAPASAPVVAAQPAPAPVVAAQPAPAASTGVDRLAVGDGVPGGLYLIPGGGGTARLEVLAGAFVFLSKADGAPVKLPATQEVFDLTNHNTSRAAFGLPLLNVPPVDVPAPDDSKARADEIAAMEAKIAALKSPPAAPEKPARRTMPIHDVAAPGAGSAVAPPDQPPAARNPEELAAMTGTVPPVVAENAAPPAQGEAPKKRGRPPGKKTTGAMATAESVATGEATADMLSGLVLCVDASATGAQDLTAYVADLAASIAASAGVPDVRFTPKDNALAFSAWKGALAAAARQSPPSGVCVIYSSDLAEPVIEALAGMASLVIRGRR